MIEENWPSLMEYAQLKKISLSTLRRYIKSGRVKYKLVDGKYYIFSPQISSDEGSSTCSNRLSSGQEAKVLEISLENERLRKEIMKLRLELDEAKMLIAIYENQNGSFLVQSDIPPELPRETK